MPTIQAHVSTADLLKAVEEMSLPELNGFVSDVLNLRARRAAPSLPKEEEELHEMLAQGVLPTDEHNRYHALRRKLQDHALSEEEHAELVRLSDEAELRNAKRLEALARLARLRGKSLATIMEELDIRPCTDE